jgi:DUF1009 family protein
MAGKLGIVAGSGELPQRLIESCRAEGRPFFVLAIQESCDPKTVADVPHAWLRLGASGTGLRILHENDIQDIVMAGGVRRPTWISLQPDWRTTRFYFKIGVRALSDFGDDMLLRAIIGEVEADGFRVVGVHDILTSLLAPLGAFGAHHPDAEAMSDIDAGLRAAKAHGERDLGQAVMVKQGVILGREDRHGTDALIRAHGTAGAVLVKMAKPHQERRVDLPTIGPKTIANAAQQGLRGIAVEAGATLVLDREMLVAEADRAGIFVIGLAAP